MKNVMEKLLNDLIKKHKIPVVGMVQGEKLTPALLETIKQAQDIEGFIIRFEDGHMAKIKCDWYCQLHRVKSDIQKERGVVALIIEEKIDDLKPLMTAEDLAYINDFEAEFNRKLAYYIAEAYNTVEEIREKNLTRKEFALNIAPGLTSWQKACIFTTWDTPHTEVYQQLVKEIKSTILRNTNKEVKYQELRKTFPTLPVWNAHIYLEE